MVYRCRAQTDDGTLCRNRVTGPDMRCYHHRGRPAGRVASPTKRTTKRVPAPRSAPPPPVVRRTGNASSGTRRVPSQNRQERQNLEAAASFCTDMFIDGGAATVADRARRPPGHPPVRGRDPAITDRCGPGVAGTDRVRSGVWSQGLQRVRTLLSGCVRRQWRSRACPHLGVARCGAERPVRAGQRSVSLGWRGEA
jgi:hypothetical protein